MTQNISFFKNASKTADDSKTELLEREIEQIKTEEDQDLNRAIREPILVKTFWNTHRPFQMIIITKKVLNCHE